MIKASCARQANKRNFVVQLLRCVAARLESRLSEGGGDVQSMTLVRGEGTEQQTESKLNRRLLRHVLAAQKATQGEKFVSLAVDKGRVGHLSLQVAVGVLGNNAAWVPPPCVAAPVFVF